MLVNGQVIDFEFEQLREASRQILLLDNVLKGFIRQRGDEYKAMQRELEALRKENQELKEKLKEEQK